MKVYLYLFEDYWEFVRAIGEELNARFPGRLEIIGLAARRGTVKEKIEKSGLPVARYDWLGDLERNWVSRPVDTNRLAELERMFGTEAMRLLINSDRELALGYTTGAVYARTPLRRMVETNDETRWAYAVGALDYFLNTFKREKPDLVFFNEFTMAYEVAAHMVAKHLGIPCLSGHVSRFGGLYILTETLERRFPSVEKVVAEAEERPEKIQQEHRAYALDYLKNFRERPRLPDYSVHFMSRAKQAASLTRLLKATGAGLARWAAIVLGLKGTRGLLRQRNGWDLLAQDWRIFREARRALGGNFFEDATQYLSKPFIYFPLHVEPESSTLVLANKNSNQLAVLEQIAKSMPMGWRLLVKEHVPMLGLRPEGFYDAIRRMPDVHLVSPFAENFRLIERSRCVVVITGTAAWEAVLLGKPAVYLGASEFEFLNEGFVSIRELSQIGPAVARAMSLPPMRDEKIVAMVAACRQVAVPLPVDAYAYQHYGQDGARKMAEHQGAIKILVDQLLASANAEKGMS